MNEMDMNVTTLDSLVFVDEQWQAGDIHEHI